MTTIGPRDVVIFAVTDLRNPSAPTTWAGRDPLLGVGSPQASPVKLRGWKSHAEAQKDLQAALMLYGLVGLNHYRYEPRVFRPRL